MNPRQRLFAILNGEPLDHVPVWLLFPYHRTSYYGDVRCEPSYRQVFEASQKYAITLNRRNPRVALFSPEVSEWSEVSQEGEEFIERSCLEYKGRRLCAETRRQKHATIVKKLLCSEADLEFFCSLPVNQDPAAITAELDAQMPAYRQEMAEFPLDLGAMMLDLGEPINPLYHVSTPEEYSIWSLTHADLVVDFLERVMVQKRLVYRYCLERRLADVYFMVGSELASPPLVSRKTFLRWIVPYAQELISLCHQHGAKVIQHYHGFIKQILPDFLTMAPDALHTIEAPPVGNCTFTQAFEVVGEKIVLIGNIQYDEFRAFTPEQMAAAVRAVLDECRGRRLILSPSAGPYEEKLPEYISQNYLAFMQAAWEYPWE
ncbi:MAG TPA: uroporphyrinogen decarboxylase family protein [Anaerolineaceae bacterium]